MKINQFILLLCLIIIHTLTSCSQNGQNPILSIKDILGEINTAQDQSSDNEKINRIEKYIYVENNRKSLEYYNIPYYDIGLIEVLAGQYNSKSFNSKQILSELSKQSNSFYFNFCTECQEERKQEVQELFPNSSLGTLFECPGNLFFLYNNITKTFQIVYWEIDKFRSSNLEDLRSIYEEKFVDIERHQVKYNDLEVKNMKRIEYPYLYTLKIKGIRCISSSNLYEPNEIIIKIGDQKSIDINLYSGQIIFEAEYLNDDILFNDVLPLKVLLKKDKKLKEIYTSNIYGFDYKEGVIADKIISDEGVYIVYYEVSLQ